MPLTRKEIQRKYANRLITPYDWNPAVYNPEDAEELGQKIEKLGIKAYDIADELDLPLLYEVDGF